MNRHFGQRLSEGAVDDAAAGGYKGEAAFRSRTQRPQRSDLGHRARAADSPVWLTHLCGIVVGLVCGGGGRGSVGQLSNLGHGCSTERSLEQRMSPSSITPV